MRLLKLQDNDKKVRKLRVEELLEGWEEIEEMLHYQSLLYIVKIIYFKLISRHHNDLLVGYFNIEKTQELIAQKYY